MSLYPPPLPCLLESGPAVDEVAHDALVVGTIDAAAEGVKIVKSAAGTSVEKDSHYDPTFQALRAKYPHQLPVIAH